MREIKFRAWGHDSNDIEDGYMFYNVHLLYSFNEIWFDGDIADLNDDEWKVMQYTGLKDKNGKGELNG